MMISFTMVGGYSRTRKSIIMCAGIVRPRNNARRTILSLVIAANSKPVAVRPLGRIVVGRQLSDFGRIFAAAFSNSLAKEFVAIVRSTR